MVHVTAATPSSSFQPGLQPIFPVSREASAAYAAAQTPVERLRAIGHIVHEPLPADPGLPAEWDE